MLAPIRKGKHARKDKDHYQTTFQLVWFYIEDSRPLCNKN